MTLAIMSYRFGMFHRKGDANMNYFTHCKTLDDLKAEYRRLAKQNHPDLGESTEEMQRINAAYAEAFDRLQKQHNASHDEWHQSTEAPEDFINIVDELVKLDGLEVELCGSWLWIGGNTREHKEKLKSLGCRWCSKKKLWSRQHEEDGSRHYRGKCTIDEIRTKYGSQVFAADGRGTSGYARLGATA